MNNFHVIKIYVGIEITIKMINYIYIVTIDPRIWTDAANIAIYCVY